MDPATIAGLVALIRTLLPMIERIPEALDSLSEDEIEALRSFQILGNSLGDELDRRLGG